jgi:hypothetical protein
MNKTLRNWTIGATALLAGAVITVARPGIAQNGPADVPVKLQSTTPGTAQSGHFNISGTAKAGYFKGNGLGLLGLNANNISVGTLSDDRLSANIPKMIGNNTFNSHFTFIQPLTFETFADLNLVGTNVNVKSSEYYGAKDVAFFGNYSDDNSGRVELYGPNGSYNVMLATPGGLPNNGWLGVKDANSATQANMYVNAQGQGVISGDIKNFVVPNQRNLSEDIVYASVEGPEAAAYIRGTGHLVNGRARIDLPQHFQDVAVLQGMTVQLTPQSLDSKGLAAGRRTLASVEVGELNGGHGNYDFDWEVKAVRVGHEDYKPIRSWDEALPSGSKAQQWNARVASIQARQALRAQRP